MPLPHYGRTNVQLELAIAQWNMMWEAAQFRRLAFSEEELPPELCQIAIVAT